VIDSRPSRHVVNEVYTSSDKMKATMLPLGSEPTFQQLLQFLESHLSQHVLPFWTKYGLDWEHGGIFNFLEDNGRLISTDKALWSQGRALWVYSALYNYFDRSENWLKIADSIAAFIIRHSEQSPGAWAFTLRRDGQIVEPPQSIYVDAFVMHGLTEYARATNNERALDLALDTYRRTECLLRHHTELPTRPHHIPSGLQAHGPSMIFALVYHELGLLTGRSDILNRALDLAEIVMSQHLHPDHQLLYEFVLPGGQLSESDAGKTIIPGHAIESMWIMERIYAYHRQQDRVALALKAIRWHMERGWDPEFGGLFLAVHRDGGIPIWHSPDSKVWWPITESLFALLRAYELSGESWCLDWYWRVHEYAFRNYPNPEDGEWFQNLDRQGRRIPVVVKTLPVKDPFHLPRALLYSILVLRRLTGNSSTADEATKSRQSSLSG